RAGVAGQTALSGSQIKPPALPEVHDFKSANRYAYKSMAASNSPAHNNCARNVWLIVVSGPVLLSVLVRLRKRRSLGRIVTSRDAGFDQCRNMLIAGAITSASSKQSRFDSRISLRILL